MRDIDPVLAEKFIRQVDLGEAAAVALAIASPGCLLLIEDAEGRRVAESEGIRCIGAAGLLLRAKRAGLIASLSDDLNALRMHGYFLGERLVRQLLVAAGERVVEQGASVCLPFLRLPTMSSKPKNFLSSPHLGMQEFECVREAFAPNWIAPLGPHVDAFEREFGERLNHPPPLCSM